MEDLLNPLAKHNKKRHLLLPSLCSQCDKIAYMNISHADTYIYLIYLLYVDKCV